MAHEHPDPNWEQQLEDTPQSGGVTAAVNPNSTTPAPSDTTDSDDDESDESDDNIFGIPPGDV